MATVVFVALACACGSSPSTQHDMAHAVSGDMAMMTTGGGNDMANMIALDMVGMKVGDMAMMMASGIPDPGNAMPVEADFNDVPGTANQTPETAIPLGQEAGPSIYLWVTNNTIAAGKTDYFVFGSKNGGTFHLGGNGVCSGGAMQVLTKIDLWNVVNHQMQTPPVAEWTPSAGSPNCIPGMATLVSGNTYLIGFTAGANGGSYSA